MKERKERIKTIAIVFLAVLLILTLFSNTIMNYSLVEVSTNMIVGDSITTKVRGTGTIQAGEEYTLVLSESRKIATVNVKTGAEVSEGDVLLTLEETESDELTAAREAATSAKKDYETAVIESGISAETRLAIESGTDSSLSEKQNKLQKAQAAIDAAQEKVDKLVAKKTKADSQVADTTKETKAYVQAQKKLTEADTEKTNKELAYQVAQTKYNDLLESYNAAYPATGGTDAESGETTSTPTMSEEQKAAAAAVATAKQEMKTAYDASIQATEVYNQRTAELTAAQQALEAAKDTSASDANASKLTAQIEAANRKLEEVTNDYSELTKKFSSELSLASQYQMMLQMQEKVSKLEEKVMESEITSPISGKVTGILYTAGQTVTAQETVLTIQPENKAFTLQFSVSGNQAKRIKVGDPAEVMYNWYGDDIKAKVTSIRRDPDNKENSLVICEVEGNVSVGDSYTLSIGEQSANYDLVVPTSSIREDANGNFILIIESKSTPLGNRYYARRVDVEIITSDDTKSAITGALEGYEYVITTTTKPVEENQQVRLAD